MTAIPQPLVRQSLIWGVIPSLLGWLALLMVFVGVSPWLVFAFLIGDHLLVRLMDSALLRQHPARVEGYLELRTADRGRVAGACDRAGGVFVRRLQACSKAIVLSKDNDQFAAQVREVSEDELRANTAEANVTVAVEYSIVNYKDALALANKGPVVRRWPLVAGIDAAGTVLESADARFASGDKVLLNGWGVGEQHWGGLAQRARFKGDWLVRLPVA